MRVPIPSYQEHGVQFRRQALLSVNGTRPALDRRRDMGLAIGSPRVNDQSTAAPPDGAQMTAPGNTAAFHAAFDKHPGDRVELFKALADRLGAQQPVLYPGSFVDIAPSVWFDDVAYLDIDNRAATFFQNHTGVSDLVSDLRHRHGGSTAPPLLTFLHSDYRETWPIEPESVGVLISLYAGFISEYCTHTLRLGGTLLVNSSHGDAAMASLDPRYRLSAVVTHRDGRYKVSDRALDRYLVPKKDVEITRESLHASGKGVAYTTAPFAYLFTRVS